MPTLPLPLTSMCALACDASLLPRVRMAIAYIAQEVFMEAPTTLGYPLRWNLAKTVLSPTDAQAQSMLVGLVVTPPMRAAIAATGVSDPAAVAAAITDEQLLDGVRHGWNSISGVSPSTVAQPTLTET
ncbi:hypothetical protein [Streptomyces sp. BV286]|uniref:hypothetical protein n=1 Tax=Streptomyces sp. BV286 TaxID=2849672 RepID=UPI0027E3D01C|nr:hypothetical protein [Streptomyces sp. BV286]